MEKLRAGIIGATGMVGQRFALLLHNHPYFNITALAASPRSAGKTYAQAVEGRWAMNAPIPESLKDMAILSASDIPAMSAKVDIVFCAVEMDKDETRKLEEDYARAEIPVVSNNSATRRLPDVPMIIPEINADHIEVIDTQRARLGSKYGFIVVKPNCSIQSYVPALDPLLGYGIKSINVCTYQAISGGGKTFETWPEMVDNVIPYIGSEEEKSEQEPLKIWGKVKNGLIESAQAPVISAQCYRVAALDGHLAAVSVSFEKKPSKEAILEAWRNYEREPQKLSLPSAPKPFLKYFEENDRPQTRLDRDFENGMGITIGRLREDNIFDYKFACLSHNTLRGAAGGGVLTAELLVAKGIIKAR